MNSVVSTVNRAVQSIDQRRDSITKKVKWGLFAVAGLLVAPIIMATITGMAGLVVAGVLGLAVINLAPVMAMKFANWKLKGIKNEARTNPIETMQMVYHQKKEALDATVGKIESFSASVMSYASDVQDFSRRFPEKAEMFQTQLKQMQELLSRRKQAFKEAKAKLAQFQSTIDEADAMWTMSQRAQEMNRQAGLTEDDVFAKIKVDTAMDAVQDSMNEAFAQLDTLILMEEPTIKQISHEPSNNVVDVVSLKGVIIPRDVK